MANDCVFKEHFLGQYCRTHGRDKSSCEIATLKAQVEAAQRRVHELERLIGWWRESWVSAIQTFRAMGNGKFEGRIIGLWGWDGQGTDWVQWASDTLSGPPDAALSRAPEQGKAAPGPLPLDNWTEDQKRIALEQLSDEPQAAPSEGK